MIQAISGDVEFIQAIGSFKFNGFVHSTFDKTINIQSIEHGELYTLACCLIDNGPNTLVIKMNRFQEIGIETNDTVYVENKMMYIGNKLSISFEHAKNWESVLPSYPIDIEIMKKNLVKMKDYIIIHGKSGGIKKALTFRNSFEEKMAEVLEKRTNMLYEDLLNNRMSSALHHALSLIGLGPGLTPSGDDFLVGLFTTFNIKKSPLYLHKSFCNEVVEKAKPLTNDISYITLRKASIGKVRESINSLIYSLLNEDEEDLNLTLNKVLNIGSSSGTDIALGIVSGLEASITIGGK